MAVTERRARSNGDDRARLALVRRVWSANEVALADEAIDRFFADLRCATVEVALTWDVSEM